MDFEFLFELERRVHDPAVRRDPAQVSAHLAESFREVGSSGTVWTRAEIIAALAEESPASIHSRDFHAEPLAPEAVLVTYLARIESLPGAPPGRPARTSFRSSLWQLQPDGRWLLVFHQGTPLC